MIIGVYINQLTTGVKVIFQKQTKTTEKLSNCYDP